MTTGSDLFADAPLLAATQNFATHELGPSATAGTEPGEPLGADTPDPIDRTRWARFVPAVDGRFGTVGLLGDGSWRKVSLYRGDGTLSGLVPMGTFWTYWGGTTTSFRGQILTAGQTYWLQVGTEVGDVDTDYQLFLTFERKVRAYGDWIQGDDFVREVDSVGTIGGPNNTGQYLPGSRVNRYGSERVDDVPGRPTTAQFKAVQSAALTRDENTYNDQVGVSGFAGLLHIEYFYDDVGDRTRYWARSEANAWHFSAWDKRNPPPTPLPAGVTGIEWEPDDTGYALCKVLGGTLVTVVTNASIDTSTTPDTAVADGLWATKIMALAKGTVSWQPPASGSPAEYDYIAHHDYAAEEGIILDSIGPGREMYPPPDPYSWNVSNVLDEYGHLAVLQFIDKDDFNPPTEQVMTWDSADPAIAYGALMSNPYVDMLMHPPRHRFYTETWETYLGSVVPPLRHLTRRDGLNSTSGRVTGGRSQQGSARRVSGHW